MTARALLLAFALLALPAPGRAAELIESAPRPLAFAVQDRDGRDLGPTAIGGRLKLVHFWASWCVSCRTEFPAIDALQRDLREKGITVAAVSLDRYGWWSIDKTVGELGIRDVTLLHDRDREAAMASGVVGLPTTLVVDAEGQIGRAHV